MKLIVLCFLKRRLYVFDRLFFTRRTENLFSAAAASFSKLKNNICSLAIFL